MASAYYSNEEAVLQRQTDVTIDSISKTPQDEISSIYEVEKCVQYIKEKHCKNVALQFPDSLLADSQHVAKQLEAQCEAKFYILADTSYGHSDVDEVNANHITADLLIHYGESALTPSATIPTLFVFGRPRCEINPAKVCDAFCQTFPNKDTTRIVFLHHVMCDYIAGNISDILLPDYPYLSIGHLNIPKQPGGASSQSVVEEGDILKDLCTKSCPGCPCRTNKTDLKTSDDETMQTANGAVSNNKQTDVSKNNLGQNEIKKDSNSSKSGSKSPQSLENLSENQSSAVQEKAVDNLQNGNGETPMEVDDTHKPDCKDYVTGCYTIPLEHDKNLTDYSIFFLGSKRSESLRNLMLEHPTCVAYVFDPDLKQCEKMPSNSSRQLMKRYYLMEKAKDAKIVGIIAGTMGVAGYLECVNYMKKIAKLGGKKSYTFIVGKLNPEKLANFMEIDIFVLVANPENNLLDSSNFYRPVVTPYELEVACNPNREWTGNYVTDFRKILPGGSDYVEFPSDYEAKKDNNGTTMSLVTGNIRTTEIEDWLGSDPLDTTVAARNNKTELSVFGSDSAAHRLSDRSWKGLEQKLGETPVEKAKEGRTGLPVSYTHEADF